MKSIADDVSKVDLHDHGRVTVADALARLPGPGGESFVSVFEHGSLVVEILAPPSLVPLPPHTRDELYIVVGGSGELLREEARLPVAPGDFFFVPAGMEHHFENFTDDLVIWAIFYGPEGGESSDKQRR